MITATRDHRLSSGRKIKRASALVFALLMIASPAYAGTAAQNNYQRVPTPHVKVDPESASLRAGETISLSALPQGGEAILFSVEWAVREGLAGGTVSSNPTRQADGSYLASYTAPQIPGIYHVIVRLKEVPNASAVITLTVK